MSIDFNPSLARKLLDGEVTPPLKKHKLEPPTTPPRALCPIPATPRKLSSRVIQQRKKFPNAQNQFKADPPFKTPNITGIEFNNAYQVGGRVYSLIQQRSSKDCGGAALLMLFTDLMRQYPSISLSMGLLEWASKACLEKAVNLVQQAKVNGLNLERDTLPPSTAIETLRSQLQQSAFSVIVSISEPLGGHWIVVDHIDSADNVYFRDPHYGKAFCASRPIFLSYLDEKGIDQYLFVSKTKQN